MPQAGLLSEAITPSLLHPRMNTNNPNKRGRDISAEEMNKFLSWLAPDREEAGRKYHEIHQCLTAIFIRRGYAAAEDMADEAINRVIHRVGRDSSFEGEDRIPYFVRVAANLHIERQRTKPPPLPSPPLDTDHDHERADLCLEHCLQQLESDERDLILRYYQDEKRAKIESRRRLAEEFGLALETLRLKIHRIKARLRPCLEDCLAQADNL